MSRQPVVGVVWNSSLVTLPRTSKDQMSSLICILWHLSETIHFPYVMPQHLRVLLMHSLFQAILNIQKPHLWHGTNIYNSNRHCLWIGCSSEASSVCVALSVGLFWRGVVEDSSSDRDLGMMSPCPISCNPFQPLNSKARARRLQNPLKTESY